MTTSTRLRTTRASRRVGVAFATVTIATLGLAMPAWAHVEAELGDMSQSGLAEITFGFHHGCDGEATTALRIEVPDGVSDITLEPATGFTTSVTDTEFGWSGGSVPDGDEASFVLTAQLSGQEGEVIAFPTIQQCGDTELAWIEPPDASSEDESEHPAPSVVLPATVSGQSEDPADAGSATTASTVPTGLVTTTTLSDTATPETTETNTNGLIVFIVIVVILVAGALYLYLSNRKPRPPAERAAEQADEDDGPEAPPTSRSPH